jgi:hypothetical protein
MAQMEALAQKPLTTEKHFPSKGLALWHRSFYFWMSLFVAAVVLYGFSGTVGPRLFHPPSPPPPVLYVHAVLFAGWVVFFITQSALVRTRNVKVHRRLGWFGLALGILIPIVGSTTAIVMTKFRIREGSTDAAAFMVVPLWDMVAFSVAFAFAFYWRTKPEFHRRAMLMATCALTAAAFGRLLSIYGFYAGVDALILLGVVRDLLVTKRVHPVYLYGLPLMMLGQLAAVSTVVTNWPAWLRLAHTLLA